MKIKLYDFILPIFFLSFIDTARIKTFDLHFYNINNNLNILAIVNNTKSNMGIIIIGMIVVILALVGYTLISNRK